MRREPRLGSLLLGGCIALSACVMEQTYDAPPPPTPVPDLVENRGVYTQDALDVLTVNLTVPDLVALAAVNANAPSATAAVVFQEGTYGVGATAPNGTIEIRGSSSRDAMQHSYKVKLTGDAWRGMTKLNLVKHPFDLTRARNRLSFEYMRSVPNFTSLRTQFVHVILNGEDLGLYENVENPGKSFLTAHGLAVGELYKAVDFAFYDLTDLQRTNSDAFTLAIESKGIDTDHAKLEEMLRDVNDPFVKNDYVFSKYFNLDNVTTWLAINLLMGNFDTNNQNFMIYSPPDSDGWYLMPWDYDGAWGFNGPDGQPGTMIRPPTRMGLATWWLSPLFQRFVRDPKNVTALESKMDALLATVLSDDKTKAMLASYHDIIRPYISSSPDLDYLPAANVSGPTPTIAAWEAEYARLGGQLARSYDEYYAVRERPMPIFLADPQVGSKVTYRWDASFSLQGDPLTYDIEVSRTPTFGASDLVFAKTGLTDTEIQGPGLAAGNYFWRVTVRDAKAGTAMDCAELYQDADGKYPGVRLLTIP